MEHNIRTFQIHRDDGLKEETTRKQPNTTTTKVPTEELT